MRFLFEIALVALAAAFIILFMGKTGLRNMFITYSPIKLLSQLFECDFCLSFWTSLALCLIWAVITKDYYALLIPIFSTPITRILL